MRTHPLAAGLFGLIACAAALNARAKAEEPASLSRYKAANAVKSAKSLPLIVFLGDSITEGWAAGDPSLFSASVIDRGIGGQTSSQILLRFYQDVVSLHPKVVHLMAGTNDVAENGGQISDADILNNFQAMLDIAAVHGIRVVLGSIPPMGKVPWRPAITNSAARIVSLNEKLQKLTLERGVLYVNYHAVLKDKVDGFRGDLSRDGVHPTSAGYALMRPLTMRALGRVR